MPSNVGLALGTLARGIGESYAAKQKREYDERQKEVDFVSNLVSAGLQSGRIENPEEAFQFMLGQFGGGKGKGKGKGKGELHPALANIIKATTAAGGQQGNRPAVPPVGASGEAAEAGIPPVPGTAGAAGAPPAPAQAAAGGGPAGAQAAPPAGQAGAGAQLPPVPQGRAPIFRTHAQDVAEQRQTDVDRNWKDQGAYKKPDGTWVRREENLMTGDTREQPLPGEPESVARRPLGISTFPGTVEGSEIVSKFKTDLNGNPVDPKKHYKQIKSADSAEPIGVIPTEAPASEAPSKDKRQRVSEYQASHPDVSEEDATRQVDLEMREDRLLKSKEERVKLSNLWATLAGKQLTNDQKKRALSGTITGKDAVQIARGLLSSGGEKFGMDEVQRVANDLLTRFGKPGEKAPTPTGGGIPPVPAKPTGTGRTPAAAAASGRATEPSAAPGATVPAGSGPGAQAPAAAGSAPTKPFGKGKKPTAQAQRTIDTAKDVLDLIPLVQKPIVDAGAQDDNDMPAMASTRFSNYLYTIGKAPEQWRDEVIQYGGAVRAFVLTGLLAGRTNKQLQEILDQHIPNPEKDTPLQLMRKLKNLSQIAKIAGSNAAEGATMTPDDVLKFFQALPDPQTGAPVNPYRKK